MPPGLLPVSHTSIFLGISLSNSLLRGKKWHLVYTPVNIHHICKEKETDFLPDALGEKNRTLKPKNGKRTVQFAVL